MHMCDDETLCQVPGLLSETGTFFLVTVAENKPQGDSGSAQVVLVGCLLGVSACSPQDKAMQLERSLNIDLANVQTSFTLGHAPVVPGKVHVQNLPLTVGCLQRSWRVLVPSTWQVRRCSLQDATANGNGVSLPEACEMPPWLSMLQER